MIHVCQNMQLVIMQVSMHPEMHDYVDLTFLPPSTSSLIRYLCKQDEKERCNKRSCQKRDSGQCDKLPWSSSPCHPGQPEGDLASRDSRVIEEINVDTFTLRSARPSPNTRHPIFTFITSQYAWPCCWLMLHFCTCTYQKLFSLECFKQIYSEGLHWGRGWRRGKIKNCLFGFSAPTIYRIHREEQPIVVTFALKQNTRLVPVFGSGKKHQVATMCAYMRVWVRKPSCPCSLMYVNIGHHNILDLVKKQHIVF